VPLLRTMDAKLSRLAGDPVDPEGSDPESPDVTERVREKLGYNSVDEAVRALRKERGLDYKQATALLRRLIEEDGQSQEG